MQYLENMKSFSEKSKSAAVDLDMEIEEGITVRDAMVMAAEEVLIKNGTIKPISFKDAFGNLQDS